MAATLAEFERSLRAHDVACTHTSPAGFDAALADAIVDPAIGARLPFADISLAEQPVTLDPTPAELDAARTGVTAAALGIASYGTLLLRATADGSEPVSLFPERHVAVVAATDVVPDMTAAFERVAEMIEGERDSAILATGPSATADMGALVTGAHGPTHVHVLLVEGANES